MKTMIINDTNKGKIEARIDAAQVRARERLICYDDLLAAIKEIESKLKITKKAMEKLYVNVDIHAQNFARSYKYQAFSTQFSLIFLKGKWRITNIDRYSTRRYGQKFNMTMTEATKEAILQNYVAWQ